jgi:predicted DsbA family dithiol-disulfide isomerase
MCPFCYIGKRRFENALEQFHNKEKISVEWKSFQLIPGLKTEGDKNADEFLAEQKGVSIEHARAMNGHVSQMAQDVGLNFNFDKAIPANTFNAHRLIHFAKTKGKQTEAEEILFRSYFTEGKNIDDYPTLVALGKEIGLDIEELNAALKNGRFAENVQKDIYEAQQIGVRGVPFFVFNRKYAVSGAQASEIFLEVLQKSFAEWQTENAKPKLEVTEGKVCTPDGECD